MSRSLFHFRHPDRRAFLAAITLWGGLLAQSSSQVLTLPEDNPDPVARAIVQGAQVISRMATERYAHQSSMRIIDDKGYVVYQANDGTPQENAAGQVARLAIFKLSDPAGTVRWVDISGPGDESGGIKLTGRFVSSPLLHSIDGKTLRCFFTGKAEGDTLSNERVLYKDYDLATDTLSGLKQVKCVIARKPEESHDLCAVSVQAHLEHLFGPGAGQKYGRGINPACDFLDIGGVLYSTIQIKNSADGKTLLMTNVLMRSVDHGATWELLGAPDPEKLATPVKILAEPAISHDAGHVYLHLRSNVVENGYMLSRASKEDLYTFDAPKTVWGYGIGRPNLLADNAGGGSVALFTAPTVNTGPQTLTRNKCDVVQITPGCAEYRRLFSIMDRNALNTPFMQASGEEIYIAYSSGRRRLIPKFGTSEIMLSRFNRSAIFPAKSGPL
ncbi:MAG: hypothetical protein ACAI34_15965 [Verrucomicrobium sp.]